jgi:hypothetical protein
MTHSGDNRTPKFTIRRLDPDQPIAEIAEIYGHPFR